MNETLYARWNVVPTCLFRRVLFLKQRKESLSPPKIIVRVYFRAHFSGPAHQARSEEGLKTVSAKGEVGNY